MCMHCINELNAVDYAFVPYGLSPLQQEIYRTQKRIDVLNRCIGERTREMDDIVQHNFFIRLKQIGEVVFAVVLGCILCALPGWEPDNFLLGLLLLPFLFGVWLWHEIYCAIFGQSPVPIFLILLVLAGLEAKKLEKQKKAMPHHITDCLDEDRALLSHLDAILAALQAKACSQGGNWQNAHGNGQNGNWQGARSSGHSGAGKASGRQACDDAYKILGVPPNISDSDLRKHYHQIMRDIHPDALAGQGLNETLRKLAEEKAKKINAAYRAILDARHPSAA